MFDKIKYNREWRLKNKDKVKMQAKRNYERNKDKINKLGREYYKKNREHVLLRTKMYAQKNKDKLLKTRKIWYKKKYRTCN